MHTLQTGWCFYAGMDTAKRSNVWVANQSPAALAMLTAAGALPSPTQERAAQQQGMTPQSHEALMQVRRTVLQCPAEWC